MERYFILIFGELDNIIFEKFYSLGIVKDKQQNLHLTNETSYQNEI